MTIYSLFTSKNEAHVSAHPYDSSSQQYRQEYRLPHSSPANFQLPSYPAATQTAVLCSTPHTYAANCFPSHHVPSMSTLEICSQLSIVLQDLLILPLSIAILSCHFCGGFAIFSFLASFLCLNFQEKPPATWFPWKAIPCPPPYSPNQFPS